MLLEQLVKQYFSNESLWESPRDFVGNAGFDLVGQVEARDSTFLINSQVIQIILVGVTH